MLRRMPLAYRAPQYRLRDDFTTGTDITNYRTPSISGAAYFIRDPLRAMSVGDGRLTISGALNNSGFLTSTLARVAGRAMYWSVIDKSTTGMITGLVAAASASLTATDVTYGFDYNGATLIRPKTGTGVMANYAISTTGPQSFVVIARAVGGFGFWRNSNSGPYKLGAIYTTGSGTLVGKYQLAGTGTIAYSVSGFSIVDLPAPFSTDYGFATYRDTVATSGTAGFHPASGWIEQTFTYTNTTRDIFQFRRTDANNCWIIRAQSGGAIDVWERNNGTETRRSNVAQTWVNGTTYRVGVQCDGTALSSFVDGVFKGSNTSTFNQTASGFLSTIDGTDLVCWPLYADLDALRPSATTIVIHDTFSDAKPAGYYGSRAVDPGPGFRRHYDIAGYYTNGGTSTLIAVSGRRLRITGNSNNWGGTTITWSGQPRATGRTMFANMQEVTGQNFNTWVGWSNTPSPGTFSSARGGGFGRQGLIPYSEFSPGVAGAITSLAGITATGAITTQAVVLSTSGFLHLAYVDNRWTLQWPGNSVIDTVLYPVWSHSHVGGSKYLDSELKVVDLGGPWAVDYGIATQRIGVNAANDTISTLADSVLEWTFYAASGFSYDLQFRRTDDNNCLVLRMAHASNTLRLYARSGGVETEQTGGTASHAWTVNSIHRVVVVSEGSKVRVFAGNTTNYSPRNSSDTVTFNQTATGAKVTASGSEFIAWPRFIPDSYTALFI